MNKVVAPGEQPEAQERRTSSVELLWDLVFVFAVTQVTTLLLHHLTWAGFGRAMLIMALVWWAWSAFVWAANAEQGDTVALRLALLVAAAFIFIAGLAVPEALTSEGVLFASTYAAVRVLHLALYADASRRGHASWTAIAGFAITVAVGMGLLIGGAFAHGTTRVIIWAAAVAIDYAGPAWLTRERLRGLQRVAVAHFAERYSLFVIICLGESIVEIGLGATRTRGPLPADVVVVVALGLLSTIAMWWTYFDRLAEIAAQRLRAHRDPVLAAADSYSYMHLVIVAAIITLAAGDRWLVKAPGTVPSEAVRLAFCGGAAGYLAGLIAFKVRITGVIGYEKAIVAGALLLFFALSGGLHGWVIAAVVAALLTVLCAVETVVHRRGSSRLAEAR